MSARSYACLRLDEIEDALDKMKLHDWDMKFTVAHECGWSGKLRIQRETRPGDSDISTVFFITGEGDPTSAAQKLYRDLLAWLDTHKDGL